MRASRLKRVLYERPYTACAEFILSNAEAELILKKRGLPDIDALVSGACASGRLDAEDCASLRAAASRGRRRGAYRVLFKRGALIVAAALIMLTGLFLGCTPQGRAMARDIYNAVVERAEGVFYVGTRDNDHSVRPVETIYGVQEELTAFDSLKEAREHIGKPLYVIDSADYECETMEYCASTLFGCKFTCIYAAPGGMSVTLFQTWNTPPEVMLADRSDVELIHMELENGIIIDGIFSTETQTLFSFAGAAVNEETSLSVFINDVTGKDALEEILRAISLE